MCQADVGHARGGHLRLPAPELGEALVDIWILSLDIAGSVANRLTVSYEI
jgi:hypothetical protein